MTNGGWFDKGDRKLMDSLHHSWAGARVAKSLRPRHAMDHRKLWWDCYLRFWGSRLRLLFSKEGKNDGLSTSSSKLFQRYRKSRVSNFFKKTSKWSLHFEKFFKRLTKSNERVFRKLCHRMVGFQWSKRGTRSSAPKIDWGEYDLREIIKIGQNAEKMP